MPGPETTCHCSVNLLAGTCNQTGSCETALGLCI
jgi:hypothetical protein